MKLVKVAAAALNQTPLDWDQNKANILTAIDLARQQQVGLLCLPELCICGYGCEDAFHSTGLHRMAGQVLREILPATDGIVVTLGLPMQYRSALFNAVCIASDREIGGFVAKQNLAGAGLHYEPRWFKPWAPGHRAVVEFADQQYPLGDLVFDIRGIRLGFEICEDAWVADRPGAELAQQAVDIILNPSASHFAFGKSLVRERLVVEGSRAFGVTYVYSNLIGNEAGRAIYDGGAMIASAGKIVACGPRLGYENVYVTATTIDVEQTRTTRARSTHYVPDIDAAQDSVKIEFDLLTQASVGKIDQRDPWERSPQIKEEEFTRALCLALFDYMRKSRVRGFVVSLSGGADSSAVATLIATMVQLALSEIGPAGLTDKLKIPAPTKNDIPTIVRELLTTVYQSTGQSSTATRESARHLADALGAKHLEFDVDDLVKDYIAMVEQAIGRQLSWERDDLALQNIQARVRAPGAWMLANLESKLLVSTSNRSEAAVGYATMDGDTAGGISAIAGIDKAFLRQWLRWMEQTGPTGSSPIAALHRVNQLQPSAELRPQNQGQTDEDDLMPYPVLEAIEDAAIGDKKTPVEVFHVMQAQFTQYDQPQLAQWIDRFFRLWCRNQWKRERYAPSFHVDDKNLDPKTWCRFPILSGGFERELAALHELVGV